MSLANRLRKYIAAAFTGLWVVSHEHDDALAEIARLCNDNHWSLAVWDIDGGLQVGGQAAENTSDPVAAIKSINALASGQPDGSALLVLPNFHRFIQSTEVIQALARQIQQGKQTRAFVIVLSPIVQIPVELEKHFVLVEHDLPDRGQLEQIAKGVATESGELPEGADLTRLLDASAGLTRYEAEGAFSLSLVRHSKLVPESVWELKTQALAKSGLLSLHRGGERFDDLGGLEALKGFCTRAMAPKNGDISVRPRGLMLLGVPGTGKSCFAKALGNQTGRPTLVMDVGSLMGSLVGETESRVRQALRIVDAMSPAVLFLDEVEKALSGVASSGVTDSGVTARLFGAMLTWLSDHESDIFVVCTCNDISKLPPEFGRAERFDGIFFLDLPSAAEKAKIWQIYLGRFGLSEQPLPKDTDWTGAEIKSCCRLAALLDVSLVEAAKCVVPVAVTAAESVQRLRTWATGRCLDAAQGGIFGTGTTPVIKLARRVSRGRIEQLTTDDGQSDGGPDCQRGCTPGYGWRRLHTLRPSFRGALMSHMIDLPEAGRRVMVRNVRVCHVPDENPDLSHLGKWIARDESGAIDRTKHGHRIDWNTCRYWMPGPNHYPHNPKRWEHVSSTEFARAFLKLPRRWRDRLGEFPSKPALLDAYYVEQDYQRMEAYERGDWQTIGIKACCELLVPYGNASHIIQRIGTPGLWGVESDSDPDYLNQVADEELNTLLHMLGHLGVPARVAKTATKEASRP